MDIYRVSVCLAGCFGRAAMRCNRDDVMGEGSVLMGVVLVYNASDGSSWIRILFCSPTHSFQIIFRLLSHTFISRGMMAQT